MNVLNVVRHPRSYLKALKFTAAGWYFDVFMKTFRADSCVFAIPRTLTTRSGRGYFALNMYESTERLLVAKYIKGDECVLELGGCIGVVSCLVNSRLRDAKRHVVVEANPELIPHLENNKALNKSGFSIVNCVISGKAEEIFSFGDSIVSGSLFEGGGKGGKKTAVKGTSIEAIETSHDLRFDTLVMDIEGGELNVLVENRDKLNQFKLIIIENHPHLLKESDIATYEHIILSSGFKLQETLDTSKVWAKG